MSKLADADVCDIVGHPVMLGVCLRCGAAIPEAHDHE